MRIRVHAFAAVLGGATLLIGGSAWAHARLVSSTPAANATVAPPKTIILTFNEKLVPAFSGFDLEMSDHAMKAPVKTSVSKDGKSITGTPTGVLMKGAYKIIWRAASTDGHRMTGAIAFTVR